MGILCTILFKGTIKKSIICKNIEKVFKNLVKKDLKYSKKNF